MNSTDLWFYSPTALRLYGSMFLLKESKTSGHTNALEETGIYGRTNVLKDRTEAGA